MTSSIRRRTVVDIHESVDNTQAIMGDLLAVYGLKPQSHQAYDQVTTYLRPKNGQS